MAVCEKCNPAYSRLDSNIHRRENNIPEKEKLIDGFISVALAQTKQILYVPASLALSPSTRLARAVVSDCPATLPWLTSTSSRAGAEPCCPCGEPCSCGKWTIQFERSWCDGIEHHVTALVRLIIHKFTYSRFYKLILMVVSAEQWKQKYRRVVILRPTPYLQLQGQHPMLQNIWSFSY